MILYCNDVYPLANHSKIKKKNNCKFQTQIIHLPLAFKVFNRLILIYTKAIITQNKFYNLLNSYIL